MNSYLMRLTLYGWMLLVVCFDFFFLVCFIVLNVHDPSIVNPLKSGLHGAIYYRESQEREDINENSLFLVSEFSNFVCGQ